MSPACGPIWSRQPNTTSSTAAGSMPVRSTSCGDRVRSEVERVDLGEPAVASADGRAHRVDDVGLGHVVTCSAWVRRTARDGAVYGESLGDSSGDATSPMAPGIPTARYDAPREDPGTVGDRRPSSLVVSTSVAPHARCRAATPPRRPARPATRPPRTSTRSPTPSPRSRRTGAASSPSSTASGTSRCRRRA